MIIKKKDSQSGAIVELEGLLARNLTQMQRQLVEEELKQLRTGVQGEKDSAYFLDFAYGPSQNYAVIHDLRLEWKGRVAQIDHLLINRLLEVFILETKHYAGNIRVNEFGEFSVAYGSRTFGIESPIEQCNRHIWVLKDLLEARQLTPTRLGITLPLTFHPFVLVSPKSTITRPSIKTFDTSMIVKADQFEGMNGKRIDQLSAVNVMTKAGKLIGSDTLKEFGQRVAKLHRPVKINYRAKFGIANDLEAKHETPVVTETAGSYTTQEVTAEPAAGRCDKCGTGVEAKVVAFCRYNRAKLGGHKVLCRECQKTTLTVCK